MEFLMLGLLMLGLPFGVAAYGLFCLIRLWREGEEREMRLSDCCESEMLRLAAAHGRDDLIQQVLRSSFTCGRL